DELLAALDGLPGTFVVSGPNPDAGHAVIRARLQEFSRRSAARMFASLGQRWYFGLLAHADLIIGNSSSAIWEAPSFRLPAVDVGDRQRARVRAKNVIQVPARAAEIRSAIDRALDPAFRRAL